MWYCFSEGNHDFCFLRFTQFCLPRQLRVIKVRFMLVKAESKLLSSSNTDIKEHVPRWAKICKCGKPSVTNKALDFERNVIKLYHHIFSRLNPLDSQMMGCFNLGARDLSFYVFSRHRQTEIVNAIVSANCFLCNICPRFCFPLFCGTH